MSNEPNETSLASVQALLGDLRYVIDEADPAQWPTLAGEVLGHHSPPIEEVLLSPESRNLQRWCRTMLEAMIDVDEEGVRAAALKVKQFS